MNTQDITVDLSKKNVKPESIVLRQGDKSGTTLRVKVLDNGVNVSSLDGYVAKFIMKLPYNRFYYEVEGTISGSMLTFVIDESYAAVQSGVTNIAYVALVNGETTRMSANNIRVEILPSALDGFTPPPEWTNPVDEFIEEQTARVDTIVGNAESATTAANTAATNANDKAALANTAATNANNKAGLADEAATNANAKAQEADEAAQAADEAREAIQDDLGAKANKDGHYSLFGAGTSDALMSTDGEVDTFARRVSEHDGACKIVSLRGNTVRWNQLASLSTLNPSTTHNGITLTDNGDGSVTVNGTATDHASPVLNLLSVVSGHKYLVKGGPSGGSASTYYFGISGIKIDYGSGGIWTSTVTSSTYSLRLDANMGSYFNNVKFWPQCFDLTAIFGAGNEPATVEEFERQYPEDYYPYDAGSLLSVNIEGVKSIGFNLLDPAKIAALDGVTESGGVFSGQPSSFFVAPVGWEGIEYLANAQYCATVDIVALDASNIRVRVIHTDGTTKDSNLLSTTGKLTVVSTAGKTVKKIVLAYSSGSAVSVTNWCINLSDPARNGTYEPYVEHVREIPESTLFTDGILRSAGSAYDERTATKDIKRIGVVDLGALTWTYQSANSRFISQTVTGLKPTGSASIAGNIICAKFATVPANQTVGEYSGEKICVGANDSQVRIMTNTTTDPDVFKAAMDGVMLFYELATPTEAAVDPPLNIAYPVETGGTESIVIPTGEQSAAPTIAIVYAYNADGVRDLSQAIIANIEGNTASTNYAIGGYFVYAGKLHRVTSAIATGEIINPGVNCVATTVMQEVIALFQSI